MSLVGFLVLVGWVFLILFGAAIVTSRRKMTSKPHEDDKDGDK